MAFELLRCYIPLLINEIHAPACFREKKKPAVGKASQIVPFVPSLLVGSYQSRISNPITVPVDAIGMDNNV